MTKRDALSLEVRTGSDRPAREDLLSRLRFAPEAGRIWLDGNRMFLLHAGAYASLRRELIETVGTKQARGMLTRMGYQSGNRDAELAKTLRAGLSSRERLAIGPQLHALEGVALVEPLTIEIDVERGHFYGDFIWRESIEDEAHIAAHGVGSEAVCWMQIGYACGYTSALMGRAILYREVACRAMGDSQCRIIGKPTEEWEDAEEELSYFRAEAFVNKTVVDFGICKVRKRPSDNADETDGIQQLRIGDRALVGASAGFNVVCHNIKRVASTDAPVLILGESGVGKEMFARALYGESMRSDKPFVVVNCAAIPEQLIESELFGVEKGAFTGAVCSRPGRFERADGGTLFLDELACLSLPAQSKLLRAVQEGEIERVGDVKKRNVDVRIIAATNEDLGYAIEHKTFREDLYYRLNVYPIHIPPLRERSEDIYLLMEYFLERLCKRHNRNVSGFTERAIDAMMSYRWPGNVRELENVIERAVILAQDAGPIDLCHLTEIITVKRRVCVMNPSATGKLMRQENTVSGMYAGDPKVDAIPGAQNTTINPHDHDSAPPDCERARSLAVLRDVVERNRGNLSAAARELGITRAQVAYRSQKLGLSDLFRLRS